MSSSQRHQNSRRGQQTLHEAAASSLARQVPTGIILRYEEKNDQLKEFIAGNALISYVMVNFSDTLELLEDHDSLDVILEDWQVPVITATEYDAHLGDRQRDDIRFVLRRIPHGIYVPDAGKVYGDRSKRKQLGGLEEYKIRVDWLVEEIEEHGWNINLLPLAKAMERWHFEKILQWYREHGFRNFAFYAKQYYSDGNRFKDLQRHTCNLVNIVEPDNVFMIALNGPSHLSQLPPEVTGASGLKQFILNCNYDNDQFRAWRNNLETHALGTHDFWGY